MSIGIFKEKLCVSCFMVSDKWTLFLERNLIFQKPDLLMPRKMFNRTENFRKLATLYAFLQ
jgi:hypothetical protein